MNESERAIKTCCASFYQSGVVRMLLGDVLHPGGLALTHHLGEVVRLKQTDRVLDIACGRGASAIHLAESFGCHVTGLDYSPENLAAAEAHADSRGVSHLTSFKQGDAEELPFGDGSFDVVISECSFCTFPNKKVAAGEMARLLHPGGRLGMTDVTINGNVPEDMQSILTWVACIAGAGSAQAYVSLLKEAGFIDFTVEDRGDVLKDMLKEVRRKLLGLGLAASLGKLNLGELGLQSGKEMLQRAADLIEEEIVGYTLINARKGLTTQ